MTDRQGTWPLSRRTFSQFAVGGAASLALPKLAFAAPANRLKVGDIELTSFSDGYMTVPPAMLASNVSDAVRDVAIKAGGQGGTTYRSPVNVTVVKTKSDLMLIDVGSGPRFMPTVGQLPDALADAGIDPDAVTKVVYTHAHPDHIWGTVNDFDELSFPNASYYMAEAEYAFWTADDVLTQLPKERHGFAVGAQRNIKAVKDRLTMVKPGQDIVTGVRAVDTSGHTPGHLAIEVGTGQDTAMVLGDALMHPIISFAHPDWTPAIDQDKDRAIKTRKALLQRLSANATMIVATHLPPPGIGRVVKKGTGFAYEAI
ncbi:MAG: MBL fold metallo-hydrolase [Pseudomonadota bacterium]